MGKQKKIYKVNPLIKKITVTFLKLFFKKKFDLRLEIPETVANLKSPFVILANHQGFWDPFLIGSFIKETPYFVTSDAVFRSKILSFFMKLFGAIPKIKSKNDIDALRYIFEMKKLGRCIGIFPEGQRTWNGCTLPIIESTAKLVRMLNIPVVTVLLKGGYLAHPRWRSTISWGELTIEYKLLFKEGEAAFYGKNEICDKIIKSLSQDDIEYQNAKRIKWQNPKAAENIEQVLFVCPICGSFMGFTSSKKSFKCKSCISEWEINDYQEIYSIDDTAKDKNKYFRNIRDWDSWQLSKLYSLLTEKYNTDELVLYDDKLLIKTGHRSQRLKKLIKGSISLKERSLIIADADGKKMKKMEISKISGINVQNKEILDFYYGNDLYTVNDPLRHFSAYKWWRTIKFIQESILSENLD